MTRQVFVVYVLSILIACLTTISVAADSDVENTDIDSNPDTKTDAETTPAETSPYQKSIEVGCAFSNYTDGLGEGNGLFLNYRLSRPQSHTWAFSLGRDSRFSESSFGYGVTYTRHLPNTLNLIAGISSGTGQYLAPKYRIYLGVQRSFLSKRNLILDAGYIRDQSKAENRYDGWGLGATLYAGPHWLLGANVQYSIGQPGDTVSSLYGVGLTWYRYKNIYIGAGYNSGDVSYMLVSTTNALVDYESSGWFIALSKWLTDHSGINLRFDHGSTSFYRINGFIISYFHEF